MYDVLPEKITKYCIGSIGINFNERYENHKKSSTNKKKRHATELSNNIWSLEGTNINKKLNDDIKGKIKFS